MNALLRNTTLRFNPRSPLHDGYEPLDYHRSDSKKKINKKLSSFTRRTFSRRKRSLAPRSSPIVPVFDRSRSERARQRQIFLKTYKLASADSLKKSKPRKMVKRVLVKLRRAVVKIMSFARIGAVRSCFGRCVPPTCGSSLLIRGTCL